MKYFITFFFLGFFFSASAQWSPQTAARIEQYNQDIEKYLVHGALIDDSTRREASVFRDSLCRYFRDSASTYDLYQLIDGKTDYSHCLSLYSGWKILHQRGISKINLFKRYKDDVSVYRNYPPTSSGSFCGFISAEHYPLITNLGRFMRSCKYTETERDSFYQILFTTNNKHIKLQHLELLEMKNNTKHLDLVAQFAKEKKHYISIVPLMKYRFEAEEKLILEVLEKYLFSPNNGYDYNDEYVQTYHFEQDFNNFFKEKIDNKDVFNLMVRYLKEKPNKKYQSKVFKIIIERKSKRTLEVLYELYDELKSSKHNDYMDGRVLSVSSFFSYLNNNRTPVYHDLYYKVLFEKPSSWENEKYYLRFSNEYRSSNYNWKLYPNDVFREISEYLKKEDAKRYNQTVIDYFSSIKDVVNSKRKYPRCLDLPQAIFSIKDTIERITLLKTFLSAKNDFTVNNAINVANQWLDKAPDYKKQFFPQFERIVKSHQSWTSRMLALESLLKYANEKEKNKIWSWYSKRRHLFKNAYRIADEYGNYARLKIVEDTRLYLKTKNASELEKVVDSLAYQPYNKAESEVRDLIRVKLDTTFNEVYYKMFKKGWETSIYFNFLMNTQTDWLKQHFDTFLKKKDKGYKEIVLYLLEHDTEKAMQYLENNYTDLGLIEAVLWNRSLSFRYIPIDNLGKYVRYGLKNRNVEQRKRIISYTGMGLRDFPNIQLDISNELWKILEEDLDKKHFSGLAVTLIVLSFDKSQKTKVFNFYKKHFDKLTKKHFVQEYFVKNGVFTPKEYMIDNSLNIRQFDLYRDYTIIHNFYFRNISVEAVSNNMKRFLQRTDIFEIKSIFTYGRNFLLINSNQPLDLSQELWTVINNEPSSENMSLAMLLLSYDKKEKERLEELYKKSKEFLKTYEDFYTIRYHLINNGLSIND